MGRRGYQIVGAAALGLLLAMLVASTTSTSFLGPQHTGPPRQHAPSAPGPIPVSHGRDQTGLPTWFTITATILLLLLVAALLLLVASFRRGGNEEDEGAVRPPPAVDDPVAGWETAMASDLARAADEQLAALRHGSPRDAIIVCWMRLQSATRVAGMGEDPSETAVEFTIRAMASLRIDSEATTTLSGLYREARFSDHEMTERQRELASSALLVVADELAVAKVTR